MELPGTAITTQVLDLLANPPQPDLARHHNRQLRDITTDWLHAHTPLLLADARALVTMAVRMCASGLLR